MKFFRLLASGVVLSVLLGSCSGVRTRFSRGLADVTSRPANITCYSGGNVIFDGRTEGKVFSEEGSDGYVFFSKETGKLMEISGDCVIAYD